MPVRRCLATSPYPEKPMRSLLLRTAAFVLLTAASATFMALPYLPIPPSQAALIAALP